MQCEFGKEMCLSWSFLLELMIFEKIIISDKK